MCGNYHRLVIQIRQVRMKISLYCLLLLCLLSAAHSQQCPIPANCENYSPSLQKCTACQPNYLLFSNNCISILSLTSLISSSQQAQQAATTTPASSKTTPAYSPTPSPAPSAPSVPSPVPFPITTPAIPPTSAQQTATIQSQKQSIFVPWYSFEGSAIRSPSSQVQYGITQSSSSQPIYAQPSSSHNSFAQYGFTQSSSSSASLSAGGSYTDNNCKTKDIANTTCLQCYPFFYPDYVLNKCCPVNPLCKNYTNQNQCTQCYAGYVLSNGNCLFSYAASMQGIANAYTNCKNYTNNVCSECYSNFYFNSTLNQCVPTNPNCKTVTSTNQCTSCYTGYQLNSNTGDCDLQTSPSTSFTSSTASTASSASSASTASSASSSASQSSGQQSDNQYVTVNGFIYQVTSQGSIIGPLSSVSSDPNCIAYTNGYCVQSSSSQSNQSNQGGQNSQGVSSQSACYTRQVLINGKCVNVSDQCKSWSNTTAACTDCYVGYSLNSGVCQ